MTLSSLTHAEIVRQATDAANKAGAAWMTSAALKYNVHCTNPATGKIEGAPIGQMLDLRGNAHVVFNDKRSANCKAFKKAGLSHDSGHAVIEINHNFKHRQEHGLMVACVRAALDVFHKHDINDVKMWSYID